MTSDNERARDDWTAGVPAIFVSECAACGHRWYLPRDACLNCGGTRLRRSQSAGCGTVVAVTTVHRPPPGMSHGESPVGIALVDLDEGVRVMGQCPVTTSVGERVRASFTPLPRFEGDEQ